MDNIDDEPCYDIDDDYDDSPDEPDDDLDAVYEAAQVAKGAALLDKLLPGWYKVVDLSTLDMSNGVMCMLGQTFGVHAERCLAKEMYPAEWEAARVETLGHSELNATMYDQIGYAIAGGGYIGSKASPKGLINRLLAKRDDIPTEDILALSYVCGGHDTKCFWAAEVADRLTADDLKVETQKEPENEHNPS